MSEVTARKVRVKASSSKKFEKQALESALLTSKIIHVSSNDFQMTGWRTINFWNFKKLVRNHKLSLWFQNKN